MYPFSTFRSIGSVHPCTSIRPSGPSRDFRERRAEERQLSIDNTHLTKQDPKSLFATVASSLDFASSRLREGTSLSNVAVVDVDGPSEIGDDERFAR